jgi:hypothetical protein
LVIGSTLVFSGYEVEAAPQTGGLTGLPLVVAVGVDFMTGLDAADVARAMKEGERAVFTLSPHLSGYMYFRSAGVSGWQVSYHQNPNAQRRLALDLKMSR